MPVLKSYERRVGTSGQTGLQQVDARAATAGIRAIGEATYAVAGAIKQRKEEKERVEKELREKTDKVLEIKSKAEADNITTAWNDTRTQKLSRLVSQGFSAEQIDSELADLDKQYDADMQRILTAMPDGEVKIKLQTGYEYDVSARPQRTAGALQKYQTAKTITDTSVAIRGQIESGKTEEAKQSVEAARGILPESEIKSLFNSIIKKEESIKRQVAFKTATVAINTNLEEFKETYDPTKYTDVQNVEVSRLVYETEQKAQKQQNDSDSSTYTSLTDKIRKGESITQDLVALEGKTITVAGGKEVPVMSAPNFTKLQWSQHDAVDVEKDTRGYIRQLERLGNDGSVNFVDADKFFEKLSDNGKAIYSEEATFALVDEFEKRFMEDGKFNPEGFARTFAVGSEHRKAWDQVVSTYKSLSNTRPQDQTVTAVSTKLGQLMDSFNADRAGFKADAWLKDNMFREQAQESEDTQRAAASGEVTELGLEVGGDFQGETIISIKRVD